MPTAPNRNRFPEAVPERIVHWRESRSLDGPYFPNLVGIEIEEIREGYARMRLPFKPELNHAFGVVHGGVTATLIDTVVVPAIGSLYDEQQRLATVDMNVKYLGAVVGEDMVAEGWVEKQGRTICFCRAEVRTPSGQLVATGTHVYSVAPPL